MKYLPKFMRKCYKHPGYVSLILFILSLSFPKNLQAQEIQKDDSAFIKGKYETIISNVDSSPQFNPGLITSPDQLISGKIAGVNIMTNDGGPSNGSFVMIRGASSIMTTDQPLIVLDGIPLSFGINWNDVSSCINPDDIESITVLKDALSISRYGMQGSNGVIVITTKKGSSGKLKINFNTTFSISTPGKSISMLNAGQFRDLINSEGINQEISLLGNASTNWNGAIYQTATATNNQLSLSGSIFNTIPLRASFEYLDQDGTVKTENFSRYSGNISISPSFFENYLKVVLNLSGTMKNSRFINPEALIAATAMNPTQPVTSNDAFFKDNFGGYWQSATSNFMGVYLNNSAPVNPLSTLNLENQTSGVSSYNANFDADYKIQFLPDLHLHLLYGMNQIIANENYNYDKKDIFQNYYGYGLKAWEKQSKTYQTFNIGLNYNKILNSVHKIFAMISYQGQFINTSDSLKDERLDGTNSYFIKNSTENNLISLTSEVNYTYSDTYIVTLGLRHDVNSLYSEGYNTGNFPTAGLTYDISKGLLKENNTINNLIVRYEYGVSGMTQSVINDAINHSELTFETTESKDLIIDYGLFNNRINGEIDFYNRDTKNLTNNAYVSNTTGSVISYTNSGNNSNKGLEITLNAIPVNMHNFSWSVSMNAAYQKSGLSGFSSIPYLRSPVNGNYVQITYDGFAPVMFYVYKQLYSSNGKPIEGKYQDINGDGRIDSNDEIRFHSPVPDWIFGFNTQVTFKRWTAGCSFRGSIGNYVYNATNAIYGNSGQSINDGFLRNVSTNYLYTGFQNQEMISSYYVENASFLKLDNISLFYQAGEIAKGINLKVGAIIQNVLTFTRYSGVDPEVPGGIDYGFYPRPRIYSININLEF